MSKSKKGVSISWVAMFMAVAFEIFTKNIVLNRFYFNYKMFEDPFDLQYFLIDGGVSLILIFIGLKFFTWLYPKEK